MSRYPPPLASDIKQTIEASQLWSHLSIEERRKICQQIITLMKQELFPIVIEEKMENSLNEHAK